MAVTKRMMMIIIDDDADDRNDDADGLCDGDDHDGNMTITLMAVMI